MSALALFSFAALLGFGSVPAIRRLASMLTLGGRAVAPVYRVFRRMGVCIAVSSYVVFLYWPPVGDSLLPSLGAAVPVALGFGVLCEAPLWNRRPRAVRIVFEQLVWLVTCVLAFAPRILPGVPTPLVLSMCTVAAASVGATRRLGVFCDRYSPTTGFHVFVLTVVAIALADAAATGARGFADSRASDSLQYAVDAFQGCALGCAAHVYWRSSFGPVRFRFGPEGHALLGLFAAWAALIVYSRNLTDAASLVSVLWALSIPVLECLRIPPAAHPSGTRHAAPESGRRNLATRRLPSASSFGATGAAFLTQYFDAPWTAALLAFLLSLGCGSAFVRWRRRRRAA